MAVVNRFFVLIVASNFLVSGCARQVLPQAATLPAGQHFQPDVPVAYYVGASGNVYVSLSTQDHIQPGDCFICQGTRDRAMIEVMEIGRNYSVCRVVDSGVVKAGDVVLVDHIARSYAVVGAFDLRNKGYSTAEDRARVERIIAQRGGKIVDGASYATDYLVAGARPADPALPGDATGGSVIAERRAEQTHYDELVKEAYDHGVPVLNTNRLLASSSTPVPITDVW